jgi:hypothetical protein
MRFEVTLNLTLQNPATAGDELWRTSRAALFSAEGDVDEIDD